LEKQYGWAITGVSGNQVSMTFQREIELVFDASTFRPNNAEAKPLQPVSSRVDLWYIAANRELNPLPLTPEKDFFLQNIREHCRGLPQAETTVKVLLDAVSEPWVKAHQVVDDIRTLNHESPTEITKTSDTSIAIRSTVLLVPLSTKVVIEFHVNIHSNGQSGFDVKVDPKATVCYGERFNEAKMTEFLVSRIAGGEDGRKSWGGIVAELEERLLARGRK
jgi:kinetochore protein Spc7/SPC105